MSTIQGNLAAVAREVEVAQKRAEKVKGGKSINKMSSATSDAEEASHQWQSQAPYVFEQLQALDENRINHLRDVLTQLQTHEVDLVERNRISAENCLNALLTLDTSEEISAFVARTSAGRPRIQSSSRRGTTSENMLSTPTPSRTQGRRVSDASGTSESMPRSGPIPGPPRKYCRFTITLQLSKFC